MPTSAPISAAYRISGPDSTGPSRASIMRYENQAKCWTVTVEEPTRLCLVLFHYWRSARSESATAQATIACRLHFQPWCPEPGNMATCTIEVITCKDMFSSFPVRSFPIRPCGGAAEHHSSAVPSMHIMQSETCLASAVHVQCRQKAALTVPFSRNYTTCTRAA
jgi:hypothetical protein